MSRKITIIKVRRNPHEDINKELQWFGNSLGLTSLRDKDSSCFRVFITLVKKAKRNEAISSDEISQRLNLARATVVHHLSKLIDAGLVIRENKGYLLRESSLSNMVNDLRSDMENILDELAEVAKDIDERMG